MESVTRCVACGYLIYQLWSIAHGVCRLMHSAGIFVRALWLGEMGLFSRLVAACLNATSNFLHLHEEVPEIFDVFFDAVVGLGVLVGE